MICRRWLASAIVATACLVACDTGIQPPTGESVPTTPVAVNSEGDKPMEIQLTSTAFPPGGPIPREYTGEGRNLSPPLAWSGLPEGTQELALICDDPDAPSAKHPNPDPWVHWVICKIPADLGSLPEGIFTTASPDDPAGVLQGKNSWPSGQRVGYRGPLPPPASGRHRYFFKLYALDTKLTVDAKPTKEELLARMSGHVIGEGELIGIYER